MDVSWIHFFYVLKIRLFFETNKKPAKLMMGLSPLGVYWYSRPIGRDLRYAAIWYSRFHRPAFSRKSGIRYDMVLWC